MFGPKLKVDKALYDQLRECAESEGYSSVDEFVAHVLEREVKRISGGSGDGGPEADDEEKVRKRLEGLGYIS